MSERYVVTGCAGFIASSVCRRLLDAGHHVIGIDNCNDAYDPRLKTWRLSLLQGDPNFEFHELDIGHCEQTANLLRQTVQNGPVAAVINLAARAGVRPSVVTPEVYYQTNTLGTLYLLESCRELGIKKFVLASTSSVYGAQQTYPYREDMVTDRPLSPYAASKKAAETLCYSYHHLHKLDISVLRYFTVYGPAGRPDMSVFRFIRNIALGRPLTVFGDGHQERDFTFVEDISRGTVAALKPLGYEIINLGGHRSLSLMHLINTISELVGRRPEFLYKEAHPADPRRTWADVSKAQNLLGWSPEIPLEKGVEHSVAWYKQNKELADAINTGE